MDVRLHIVMAEFSGKVFEIYTSPNKVLSMVSRTLILAIAGIGLDGDRYALGKGRYQSPRAKQKIRHITFIALEAIQESNIETGADFKTFETRRNIITQNVDLNSLINREFNVGEALIRGSELCDPCSVPSSLAYKPGFKDAFDNRGVLRAEIIRSGFIAVDSPIIVPLS